MLRFIHAVIMFAICSMAIAGPARHVTRTATIDGHSVTLTLCGDEHIHYWQAEDGTRYVQTGDNAFCRYNERKAQQSPCPLPSRVAQRVTASRSSMARGFEPMAPVMTGDHRGLVILVNYADNKFTFPVDPRSAYNDLLNKTGYKMGLTIGSVRDYMKVQSYGKLNLQWDVVGPITLSQPMLYYGGNNDQGDDMRRATMVWEACKAVNNDVDFSKYDQNGDGEVDLLHVIYAGYSESQGAWGAVWPHSWQLSAAREVDTEEIGDCTFDGVTVDTYSCSAELYGTSGREFGGMGTMIHEVLHCFGLPDLYCPDENYKQITMGAWSVMDEGFMNEYGQVPCSLTAFERWLCGWLDLRELTSDTAVVGMQRNDYYTSKVKPEAYVVRNEAYPDEMWVMENIQQNAWNGFAPWHGMLITHIDYDAQAWNDNSVNDDVSHLRATVVCADNRPTAKTQMDDLFPNAGLEDNCEWSPFSVPATNTFHPTVYGGKLLPVAITDIKESGTGSNKKISFNFHKLTEDEMPPSTDEPDVPVDPDTPSTDDPDEPDDPDTPSTDEPDEPVDPDTPSTDEPDEPVDPDTPSTDEPDEPVDPDTPPTDDPDELVDPDTPSTDDPDEPDDPDTPSTDDPDEPVGPDTPSTDDPDEPVDPDTPSTDEPDEPVGPDTPSTDDPDEPDAPDTPSTDDPDEPDDPDTPSTDEPDEPVDPDTPSTDVPDDPDAPSTDEPDEPIIIPVDAPQSICLDVIDDSLVVKWNKSEDIIGCNIRYGMYDVDSLSTDTLLHEDFAEVVASSDYTYDLSNQLDEWFDMDGWTGTKLYRGTHGMKMGTASVDGRLSTPALCVKNRTVEVSISTVQYDADGSKASYNVIVCNPSTGALYGGVTNVQSGVDTCFTVAVPDSFVVQIHAAKRLYISGVTVATVPGNPMVTDTLLTDIAADSLCVSLPSGTKGMWAQVQAVGSAGQVSEWSDVYYVVCKSNPEPDSDPVTDPEQGDNSDSDTDDPVLPDDGGGTSEDDDSEELVVIKDIDDERIVVVTNMQGVRLRHIAHPGIYIVNGRKVFVK